MPRAKKTSAATANKEVKAAVIAAPAEETKPTETKKPAAKKTAPKTTAVETKVVIQANGSEVIAADLVEKATAASGVKSIKKVDVYVKPEVNKVYYVVNGDTFGDFDLF